MNTRLAGKYELVREVGAGGMGHVYEAVDIETGRACAAKVMNAGTEIDLQALLRFQQEGAVLATLKHPNIVTVYGTFLEGESCSIIMELLAGRSLRRVMGETQLSLSRIKVICDQVLSALAYAHARGIVHRDIKPDNIMVDQDDRVKVTDFGIVRILVPGTTLNTRTGTAIGTPLYMSPEQIEGQKVDGRSDLYSLGTVMYQMVTGRPPFEGDDPLTVAFQHVHKAPAPPSELQADVPEEWEDLILRALSKPPGDRFQTADTMREAVSLLTTDRSRHSAPRRRSDQIDRMISPETAETSARTESTPARRRSDRAVPRAQSRLSRPYALVALGVVAVIAAAIVGTRLLGTNKATSSLQPTAVSRSPATPGSTAANRSPASLLSTWGGPGSGPGQLTAPTGIAAGSDGRIYVADYDNARISVFTPTGAPQRQLPLRDPGTGQVISPAAITVASTGALYVLDANHGRVLTMTAGGSLKNWSERVKLYQPSGVAVSPQGAVYVVDQGHNRVVEFGPGGQLRGSAGGTGSRPRQFNFPTSVAVAPNGRVYVADQGNSRVQEFGPQGVFIRAWGTNGRGPGQFQSLAGIATDSKGNVYTTDSTLARVQVFTGSGKLLATWGSRGTGRGQLKSPVGVAIDESRNIYVVDSANDTVLKFAPVS